jgi:hypothetical protein
MLNLLKHNGMDYIKVPVYLIQRTTSDKGKVEECRSNEESDAMNGLLQFLATALFCILVRILTPP